ncbi:MAG: class I SAM-dependent methyltransferase [Armatimonadota bacterium]
MDIETLNYLLSSDGEQLIEIAKAMDGSFLSKVTMLRKHYPASVATAALELIDLRKRATRKFTRADRMFFTKEALEQSSGETISRYRAERYPEGCRVLDLACGIGGDTIGLAGRCTVTAVDIDPVRIAMAKRNIEVYGLSDKVEFICDDVTKIPLNADAAFLDPSRRSNGRRVTSLTQITPSIDFIKTLVESIPDCAVKLSPATDDSELESLNAEIEFISESGECKEALAWFGNLKHTAKSAVVLPQKAQMVWNPASHADVALPGRYIIEPEPCIIRGHMVDQLAEQIGAWKIDPRIAYLSADSMIDTPFADGYSIIDSLPFNIKEINNHLRILNAGRVIIKKRGVPFEPIEIERKLKLSGKDEVILFMTRVNNKPWAFICRLYNATASNDV